MTGRLTVQAPSGLIHFIDDSESSVNQAIKKLAEYEAAEEEGRLVVLPCKIESAVYLICHRYTECSKYGESFEEYSCSGCEEWDCDSRKEYYIHVNQSVSLEWIVRNMRMGNFGKTVFLTKEDAEKALKEMEEYSEGINKRANNSRTS